MAADEATSNSQPAANPTKLDSGSVVTTGLSQVQWARVAVGAGPAEVERLDEGELGGLAVRNIVGVEIEVAVAVGIVVDGRADPHGIAAGAIAFADFLSVVGFDIEAVQVRRHGF